MKNWYRLYILKTRNSISCRLLRQQFYLNFIGSCLSYTAWSGFSCERIKYLFSECLSSQCEGGEVRLARFIYVHQRNPFWPSREEFYQVPPTFKTVSDSPMVQGWLKLCTYIASPASSQRAEIPTKSYDPRWEMMHFNIGVSM